MVGSRCGCYGSKEIGRGILANVPELTLVFDCHADKMPQDVRDAVHELACECHGGGNPCYFHWDVGMESDEYSGQGMGYISRDQEVLIDKFLLSHGAKVGQSVLICNWW